MSLLDSDLGTGRSWTRVGDCYDVTRKPRKLDQQSVAFVPFAPMEAIPQNGAYLPNFTMKAPAAIASGTYFERGDILIGKITPSFENGKQAFAKDLPLPFGYATTEVIPVHPRSSRHDARLLFFYLLHPDVRHHVAGRMEGSTGRKRVPESVILDLPIPVFATDEETAIADALELIQKAKLNEFQCAQKARELKQAAMGKLFARGLNGESPKDTEIGEMPETWEPRPLADLCTIWSGGTPRKSVPEYWNGDIPWASGKDLKSPSLDDTIDHVTSEGVAAGSRIAPAGAVLILVRGMGLARDLPVSLLNRPMAFNQDLKALVSRGDYPGAFLRSAIYNGKERLLSRIVPSAHGTMTLNLNDIETFKIPCPRDPAEAVRIATAIETIDRKVDLHRRRGTILHELFNALLHKVVTGEVIASDLDGFASKEAIEVMA